jgi:hypothetical protein
VRIKIKLEDLIKEASKKYFIYFKRCLIQFFIFAQKFLFIMFKLMKFQSKILETNSKNKKISSKNYSTFSPEGKAQKSIYYKGLPLNSYLEQVIIGLILGDGTLVKKYESGNTYFKYSRNCLPKPPKANW